MTEIATKIINLNLLKISETVTQNQIEIERLKIGYWKSYSNEVTFVSSKTIVDEKLTEAHFQSLLYSKISF